MSGFDLSQESYDEDYAEVAPGVYSVSEKNFHPGGASFFPPVNNRCFVYKVQKKNNGQKHLLMSGIPGKSCIPRVQKIEADTGLTLTLIVGGGDFHHMSLKNWLDAYPKIKVLQSDMKFPNTRNGKEILANPKYKKQIELSHDVNFPQLEEYKDTVRFFGFDQFSSYQDKDYMSKTVDEPTKESFFKFMSKFPSEPAVEPVFLVWHYHVPSKQLVYDHNFLFHFTAEEHSNLPFPLRMMMPKEACGSACLEQFPHGPTTREGCQKHCRQMVKLLELDVRAFTDYHAKTGVQVRTWKSKEDFQKDFSAILEKTGEHDPTGESMYKVMNPPPKSLYAAAVFVAAAAVAGTIWLARNKH